MRDLRRERALGVAVAALDLMDMISPPVKFRQSFVLFDGITTWKIEWFKSQHEKLLVLLLVCLKN